MKLTPLHFALNTSLWGTDREKFEMHITSISSVHPRDMDTTANQVTAEEDEGLRIVRSCGITFKSAEVVQAVLDIIPDSVDSPTSEVACHS